MALIQLVILYLFLLDTELLFDIFTFGSLVVQVDSLVGLQDDVVRHTGVDAGCGHADDDARFGYRR